VTTTVLPSLDSATNFSALGVQGLQRALEINGRMPPVTLYVRPLAGGITGQLTQLIAPALKLDRFLSYNFSSSILVPVDSFSFSFVAPDGPPLDDVMKEGDLVTLAANDVPIATGVIDQTYVETENSWGEKGTINGRDLLGQLEDQDAINMDSSPIWGANLTIQGAVRKLLADTRITQIELRDAPQAAYLLATEPGEKKLAALQRFLEPLNCISWMGPSGQLIIGKPNMSQSKAGRVFLLKGKRNSNVLSMGVTRSSATIPNAVVPIWSGQETTVDRVGKEQVLKNGAPGPARLFKLGHRVPATVVVSTPDATTAQGKAQLNALLVAAGGGNLLQAYAKREIARRNVQEIVVQAVVPGHYNDNGMPYMPDTVYHVEYDRGKVDENMYLYQVDYELTAENGQRSILHFCRLGTIVSDVRAP
jgi:prophage tail gpP-like protein